VIITFGTTVVHKWLLADDDLRRLNGRVMKSPAGSLLAGRSGIDDSLFYLEAREISRLLNRNEYCESALSVPVVRTRLHNNAITAFG